MLHCFVQRCTKMTELDTYGGCSILDECCIEGSHEYESVASKKEKMERIVRVT